MANATAAMIVIGDEILSGRTQDKNIAHIATELGLIGIDFSEARVIPDVHERIVSTVNQLRARYDHVFTSGGIGPTHDDITTDAVAAAFGVRVVVDRTALDIITERTKKHGLEINDARLRMARVPAGASLIMNSVSGAPGYRIGNVNVMAGVPAIFRDMLAARIAELPAGKLSTSITIDIQLPEGSIARGLNIIAGKNSTVAIGSYPYYNRKTYGAHVVVRGTDRDAVHAAASAIESEFEGASYRIDE
ncbi:MAG: competence/damage-inducible protein A [Rhodobacteraceae bacterium]|nr:competence/damage-inducible protein A [Paracoccaceae bacterium]